MERTKVSKAWWVGEQLKTPFFSAFKKNNVLHFSGVYRSPSLISLTAEVAHFVLKWLSFHNIDMF